MREKVEPFLSDRGYIDVRGRDFASIVALMGLLRDDGFIPNGAYRCRVRTNAFETGAFEQRALTATGAELPGMASAATSGLMTNG